MAEDIAGHLHPGVAHMALPADLLNAALRNPHVHMDDVATPSRAGHHKAMAVHPPGRSHQAALRPDPSVVADGVAVSRGARFASHLGITFDSHVASTSSRTLHALPL